MPGLDKYMGRLCDQCQHGRFNFPHLQRCYCNAAGVDGAIGNKTDGKCICKDNFKEHQCEQCKRPNIVGSECDKCLVNHFGYQNCNGR